LGGGRITLIPQNRQAAVCTLHLAIPASAINLCSRPQGFSRQTRGFRGCAGLHALRRSGNRPVALGNVKHRNIRFGPRCHDIQIAAGDFREQRNGAMTASSPGNVLAFGLANAQERGFTFIEPGEQVYEGMIVGIQKRPGDMAVNVCKEKKQTNMRSSNADIMVRLTPATKMSLEQCLDFLADDELLEVTPKHLRLRKRHLTEVAQSRARRTVAG